MDAARIDDLADRHQAPDHLGRVVRLVNAHGIGSRRAGGAIVVQVLQSVIGDGRSAELVARVVERVVVDPT